MAVARFSNEDLYREGNKYKQFEAELELEGDIRQPLKALVTSPAKTVTLSMKRVKLSPTQPWLNLLARYACLACHERRRR